MIARLEGKLVNKKPTNVIIDVNGVGYRVFVSLNTFYVLPDEGQKTVLGIYTNVREDAIYLYGFATNPEKEVFEKLISVSKIGPKVAMAILSGISPKEFAETVLRKDLARLSSIPGVGKKTAERITVELADKFKDIVLEETAEGAPRPGTDVYDDAVEALVTLGYRKQEAQNALKKIKVNAGKDDLESILKQALQLLSS